MVLAYGNEQQYQLCIFQAQALKVYFLKPFIETHGGMCRDKIEQEWVLTLSQFSLQESAWIP